VEEAVAQVRELIKQRPDYAEAYFNLGGMLYSKADLDGAIGAYQHALKLKPDYTDARHNLNVALEDQAAKSR
jgi:cytochrome c-type biogenesis protein CcmH/NrfG